MMIIKLCVGKKGVQGSAEEWMSLRIVLWLWCCDSPVVDEIGFWYGNYSRHFVKERSS